MGIQDWLLEKKVKNLLKGLESNTLEVQKKSALALLEIKNQVMDELIKNFDTLNSNGKKGLVVVFGRSDDERAVNFLISLLKDDDILLRDKAIESLLALGKDLVALPMLEAIPEGNRTFRSEVLKVLNKMNLQDIPKNKKMYYYIAKDEYHECIDIGDAAVQPLLDALEEHKKEPDRRRSIVIALGKLGNQKATPFLIEALADEDKYVRERAIEALGNLGDKSACEALGSMLEDPNGWVRKATAKALDELCWIPGNKTEEANYQLAKKNYKKCIDIGKPAVGALIKILNSSQEHDSETIREVISALGKIGDVRSCNAIIGCLREQEPSIRECSIQALKDVGPVASSFILKELNETKDDKTKEALIRVLGEIGDEQSAVTLLELLSKEKALIKGTIALALGKIKCKDAVKPLIEIIQDKSGGRQTVESAVIALGEIGDGSAAEALIELMKESQYMMSKVKNLAAQALGKIKDERAVNILIESSKDKTCSINAIEALGNIGSPDAAEALYQLMIGDGDNPLENRLASVKALEKIGGEEIQAILYASLEDVENEKIKKGILTSLNNLGANLTGKPAAKLKKRKLRG